MKPFLTLALTLVLTAALLVGCGCTNQNTDLAPTPTVLPTNEEMWNTTEAPTRDTTLPTDTQMTTGAATDPTRESIDNGNGGIDDTLNTTITEETAQSRARQMVPGTR